uniref:uracil phosphoribosyltransferase n=1 Tax=Haptolina ericina TaxID=156174 RepID=A0A7S3B3F8_9EUKA
MEKPIVLRDTPLTRALHTKIRDQFSSRHTFVTCSDRLVQMLLEEACALLPTEEVTVDTPCGPFQGVRLPEEESLCAVSIMRGADCMLGVVRTMMPSIAVGKILIQRDEATALPQLMYSKLPPDISSRPAVLLLDPMLATGGSAVAALKVLIQQGVEPRKVIFVNVVCAKEGIEAVKAAYPEVRIVTSAVDPILNEKKYIVPGLGDFGDRYFGTDGS